MSKVPVSSPLELKISTVVAVAVLLRKTDIDVLNAAMHEITNGETDYFDGEPAIFDIGSVPPGEPMPNWAALVALFRYYRLNPVAVRNASPDMVGEILAHGLSLDTEVTPRRSSEQEQEVLQIEPAPMQVPLTLQTASGEGGEQPAMIIDTPVRAGQRVYAKGRDLIVTAAVNNGAEVIADGSIHVYAPLRGRALAGASGNDDARIFALCMEAELVSIAGVYRNFENGLPHEFVRAPVEVRLNGPKIDITAINMAKP